MNRPSSFDASVLALRGKLRANAVKLTRNRDLAEDLVQDTIEKALRTHEMFRHEANLIGWLFIMMRNIHYTQRRKNWRVAEDPDGIYASALSAPAEQEPRVEFQDVARAFERLSRDHQDVLIGVMDDASYDEMATSCGVTIGTIKSRVSRARATLREMVA